MIRNQSERNAIGSFDDVLPDLPRKELIADDTVDHRGDFVLCQPIDSERRQIAPSYPRRLEFGPECRDQRHTKSGMQPTMRSNSSRLVGAAQ